MAIYSGFFPWKMVIFHSYVSLPEGIECNKHQRRPASWPSAPSSLGLLDPHTAAKQGLYGDKGLRGGLNLERPKGSGDTTVPWCSDDYRAS